MINQTVSFECASCDGEYTYTSSRGLPPSSMMCPMCNFSNIAVPKTDLDVFNKFCKTFGLDVEREDGHQVQIQIRSEHGNGLPDGPVFYFELDGSFTCQE